MTTEKRGSEKLKGLDIELCTLTDEELAQVAGGALPPAGSKLESILRDWFPYGIFPPEYFEKLGLESLPQQHVDPVGKLAQKPGLDVSNGF